MYIKRQENTSLWYIIENLSVSTKKHRHLGYFTSASKDIITVSLVKRCWKESTLLKGMLGVSHQGRHFSMTRKLKNPYTELPMSNKINIDYNFPIKGQGVRLARTISLYPLFRSLNAKRGRKVQEAPWNRRSSWLCWTANQSTVWRSIPAGFDCQMFGAEPIIYS